MANQRPFDDFLTQPLQAPRNPAAEAGMGGPFSGIMHAATNFISGAREARMRQMIEAERQQDKNLRAIQTMLEQLDKGGYDPDDQAVHGLRGELVSQLATQVAGTDDGSKPGQPGGNPLGAFLKQAAVNLMGGQMPKKAPPVTPEQMNDWTVRMGKLPTLATAQQKARTAWVEAIKAARAEADAQASQTGVPVGPEFYQNHPKLVEAALQMQRYGLQPTELGGAHQSVIRDAAQDQQFHGAVDQFNSYLQNQQDRSTFTDAATSPTPEGNLFAQMIAKQNPAVMKPAQPFRLPSSMAMIRDKSNYLGPNGERKEIYTHPGNITIDASTSQPIDVAALEQQGWRRVGQFPAEHTGKRLTWREVRPNVFQQQIVDMATGTSTPVRDRVTNQFIEKTEAEGSWVTNQNLVTGEVTREWLPKVKPELGAPQSPAAATSAAKPPKLTQTAPQQVTQRAASGSTIGGVPNPFTPGTPAPQQGTPLPQPGKKAAKAGTYLTETDAKELYEWGRSEEDMKDTYPGQGVGFAKRQFAANKPGAVIPTKDQLTKIQGLQEAAQVFGRFRELADKYRRGEWTDGDAAALRSLNEGSLPKLRTFMGDRGAFSEGDRAAYRTLTPVLIQDWVFTGRNDALVRRLMDSIRLSTDATLGTNMPPEQRAAIMKRYKIDQSLGNGPASEKFSGAKFNAPR